ncbi:hypothetical protein ACB094_10G138200 [Castanea mollissima]
MVVPRLTTLLNNNLTVNQAKQIHAQILINSLNHLEPLLVRQIAPLTSIHCRSVAQAQYLKLVLYQLQNPDAFSWGWTIQFFSQNGQFKEAFSLYVQMQRLGLFPTTFAISSALRACARIEYRIGGVLVHAQVHKYGHCICVYVHTVLVDLYLKLGDMVTAQKVFDEMLVKNVVSWNSILSKYLKSGSLAEAQRVFNKIPRKDVISWNSMVLGSIFDAMSQRNNVSWITMIAGYSKCGDVESAWKLFDQVNDRDLLFFNAMIACYAQNSQPKETIELFSLMLERNIDVQPDGLTLSSVISACSQLKFGSSVESYMNKFGIELDDHLATALVDLYAKCGSIDEAYELFRGLRKRDLIAYSAMIFGYGINGKAVNVIRLFEEMLISHICHNLVTYTGLLSAFNQAGGAGQLEDAFELIRTMPMQLHAGVWGALILACRLHSNVELAEIAAQHRFELEPDTTGYCSLLANIYASVKRWDDAKRLRKVVGEKGFIKIPGCSWMDSI